MKAWHYCESLIILGGLLLTAASASAATVYNFQNGTEVTSGGAIYSSEVDNYLESGTPNANHGSSAALRVGYNSSGSIYRSIMRFDNLASYVESGSTITGATLTLRNSNITAQTQDMNVEVYLISSANVGWNPGTSDGLVETGASSWNYLRRDAVLANSTNWTGGAGLGTPGGGGYGLTLLGTLTALDGQTNLMTLSGLESVVQGWIDNPSSNAGLLFRVVDETSATYMAFGSGEMTTISFRPLLTISAVPEPTTAGLLTLGIGLAFMAWRAGVFSKYRSVNHAKLLT